MKKHLFALTLSTAILTTGPLFAMESTEQEEQKTIIPFPDRFPADIEQSIVFLAAETPSITIHNEASYNELINYVSPLQGVCKLWNKIYADNKLSPVLFDVEITESFFQHKCTIGEFKEKTLDKTLQELQEELEMDMAYTQLAFTDPAFKMPMMTRGGDKTDVNFCPHLRKIVEKPIRSLMLTIEDKAIYEKFQPLSKILTMGNPFPCLTSLTIADMKLHSSLLPKLQSKASKLEHWRILPLVSKENMNRHRPFNTASAPTFAECWKYKPLNLKTFEWKKAIIKDTTANSICHAISNDTIVLEILDLEGAFINAPKKAEIEEAAQKNGKIKVIF